MRFYLLFSCLLILLMVNNLKAQNNSVVCEIHNLNLNNAAEDKIIRIRFLNCTKQDFSAILSKLQGIEEFKEFRNNYSVDYSVGEVYLTKKSVITTSNIKQVALKVGVNSILFNGKLINAVDLDKYNFNEVERINHSDNKE